MSNPDSSRYNARASEVSLYALSSHESVPDIAGVQIEGPRAPFTFTMALGDITEVHHKAIVCPTDIAISAIFSGGVSGAIKRKGGDEPFNQAQRLIKANAAPGEPAELPFGSSVVAGGGKLSSQGIRHIIFTSIFPPDGVQLNSRTLSVGIADATHNANRIGAASLAIPAISSGNFGRMSLEESCLGVVMGVRRYAESLPMSGSIDYLGKVSLVLYFRQTYENAQAAQELFRDIIREGFKS